MIPRRLLLIDCRRLVHTSPVLDIKSLRKPRVVANIENHEFHKIIKFVRPDGLKHWDPRRTCDLKPLDPIDPNWLKYEYRPFADMINELPEDMRKLFTVEFGQRRDGTRVVFMDAIAQTQRHKYDFSSLDYKVAWATWKIRNIQDLFRNQPDKVRSTYLRTTVKEVIDKRKSYLNKLRHRDYKRFEWILEKVGVIYKLPPPYTRIERKASINVLVNMMCNEIRDRKMNEYKEELEKEKVPFLKQKLETLQLIRADEESVGLESSVDDDIRETRKLLMKLDKQEPMTINPTNVSNANETAIGST